MKSPMIQRIDPMNSSHYTEMRVMQSPAGYYVGTWYSNQSRKATFPWNPEFLDATARTTSHLRFAAGMHLRVNRNSSTTPWQATPAP